MKITIEFEDGLIREYTPLDKIKEALGRGESIIIETCHPDQGEIFLIRTANDVRKQ